MRSSDIWISPLKVLIFLSLPVISILAQRALNGSNQPGYHYPSSGSFGGADTDSLNTGKVIISKIDPVKNIIAGTFEFTAIDKRNGRIYKITEGRFDAKTR